MMKKSAFLFLVICIVLMAGFPAFSEEICGKWDYLSVNGNEYIAQNNIWGADTAQCIDVNGTSFTVTTSNHNLSTSGSPAAYPSFFKGCHWEDCTDNSNMPIAISQIQSATIDWSTSDPGIGAYNVTTEAWFRTNSTPGAPDGAELMIWINHNGSVQPGGSQIGTAYIGGYTWEVWFSQISWNFITYRINGSRSSISLDYKPFIEDAISRGYIQSGWYMMDIEAGFEIWQGGTGLATNSFTCSVNGSNTTTPEPTNVPTLAPTNPPQNLGDVNNSGAIDIVDALLIAQYYVGLNPANFDVSKADTNCNNSVDIIDALLISQYYVGLINQFC